MAEARNNPNPARPAGPPFELADLTPEQVARLEAALYADPPRAATFADRVCGQDALAEAWRDAETGLELPARGAWEQVWANVLSASAARGRTARPAPRWWYGATAAAAALLLASLWSTPSATDAWPVQLAHHVEIEDLDSADDATPMIWSTGGSDSIDVIWIMEQES